MHPGPRFVCGMSVQAIKQRRHPGEILHAQPHPLMSNDAYPLALRVSHKAAMELVSVTRGQP